MHELAIFALNTSVALVLGLAIGVERQWRQHSAGLRTTALVALGSALFVSMSILMSDPQSQSRIDPTRIVSYVVSGLGFLGGGVILREGMTVKGINTAATVWCTGAVGALAGAGFRLEAAFGTGAILFVHIALRPVVHWIERKRRTAVDVETFYTLSITSRGGQEEAIRNILLRHVPDNPRMTIQSLSTTEPEPGHFTVVASIFALERNDRSMEDLVKRISLEPAVTGVSWHKNQA
jgi:putative Mg2+ transporter-C (MgtC) family protein